MTVRSYKDLQAWQAAMELAVRTYSLTNHFPRQELYGLAGQLRRAVVAIPSNISEGHRQGTKAYAHFVTLALGSLAEAETQIELTRRLRLAPEAEFVAMTEMVATLGRLLHGLRRSLRDGS